MNISGRHAMLALAGLALVLLSAACGPDSGSQAQPPAGASPQPSVAPSASEGADVTICEDSPAAASNGALVQAAFTALPDGLRTALSASGLQPDGGAYNGMAPAAVVSGLVGIHVTAQLKANGLDDADKFGQRITADVYVALINKDPALAAGSKPAGLMTLVRERQSDAAKGYGGYGVNKQFLPAETVADLNTLFGPVPDNVQQGPSKGPGRKYYRITVDPALTFFPVGAVNGTC